MKRTTVYFPEELKVAVEREAARRGVTEAQVIRTAVERALTAAGPLRTRITPAIPEGIGEDLAGRVEELFPGSAKELEADLDL